MAITVNNKDLGIVTAYAYALAGGYTGTEAEFEALLGNIAKDLAEIENLSVQVQTLPAGSDATASYAEGVLTLGIPRGDKGETGDQGEIGPTPQLSVGTVTTGEPGTDAEVEITGTPEAPVLNFTLPRGDTGNITQAVRYDAVQTLTDAQKEQARANIDAADVGEVADLKSALVSVIRFNDTEFLRPIEIITPTTSNGVTFEYVNDGSYHVHGEATRACFKRLYQNTIGFPTGIEAGKTYKLIYSAVNVRFYVFVYTTESPSSPVIVRNSLKTVDFTIPANAIGIEFRIYVAAGTVVDEVVQPQIVNYTEDLSWKGKIWYSYGTSMSDINPDGISGNNGTSGKWPLTVDKLSGMIRHNGAIGSGGICPSLDHGGNVKAAILSTPWDVDLVTVEAGLNDWGKVPLGEFGDTSDDTFIGNFTQCIQYLVAHTRAKIVLITMPNRTYTSIEQTERYNPLLISSYGYSYRDLLDLEIAVCQVYGVEVIDTAAGVPYNFRNKKTVKDFVHFTNLGGEIYGEYIWSKLKVMQSSNTSFVQEDYV